MKYDTPIMHHIKSVADMPKKKNVFPFSLQQVRIPSELRKNSECIFGNSR